MDQVKNTCVACNSSRLSKFYHSEGVPVSIGSLWNTRDEAVSCSKGNITLALCEDCGLISNIAFDPGLVEYNDTYDNSLDCSAVFRDYATSLATRLVTAHGLRGKRIVEIGCGPGRFLSQLCEMGAGSGIGYDPSYDGARHPELSSQVEIIGEAFGTGQEEIDADFVCCRHVLEHIPSPVQFLKDLAQTLSSDDVGVYFEVPNMMHALKQSSIGTFIYEHCGYYCASSLVNTFRLAGYTVDRVSEGYDGQFLGIEARTPRREGNVASAIEKASVSEIIDAVKVFRESWLARRQELHDAILLDESRPAVFWGGGARAVSILNDLDDPSLVHSVVDINPNKHGKFLAGSGHEIVPPAKLKRVDPNLVVVMNDVYLNEILETLQSVGVACSHRVS